MRKLDLSEIQDNFELKNIQDALRQMKKLEKQMNIWYKKKQGELASTEKMI